jgi:16S rRNA processing protein RimM
VTKRASTLASSSSTEPERFVIGRLGRPHGLDGFLGVYVDEDDVVSIQPGGTVFIEDTPHVVRALRRVDRGYQIAFEGIDDRETAEAVRGLDVAVPERRQLGEGEYWPEDLVGLAVVEPDGRVVGVVAEVVFGPGQDRLRIEQEEGGPTFEVPFVDALVPRIDLEAGEVEIDPIPGLIEP